MAGRARAPGFGVDVKRSAFGSQAILHFTYRMQASHHPAVIAVISALYMSTTGEGEGGR